MEFSINKNDFLDGINKVQGICGRKTSFPITASILLTASGQSISIVATDLEVGFQGFYPAHVEKEGKAVIPGRKLLEIVREFPTDIIVCREMKNGWIEIANSNVQFQIVGMDPEDFPKLPEVTDTDFLSMETGVFWDMLEKTDLSSTITSEEKRPHLIGVYLERPQSAEGKVLRMVSTDGNRLAKADCIIDVAQQSSFLPDGAGVILPKKVLGEMKRLAESGQTIDLGVKGNYFILRKDQETLIARLVEGEYPNYEAVIPHNIDTFVQLEKELFLMTLKRMSILCTERYRAVLFKVKNEQLELEIINPEIGESREEIEVAFNGKPFEVTYNPRFFIDAVSCMKSNMITLRLVDEKSACVVEGEHDPSYITVIMPMRI